MSKITRTFAFSKNIRPTDYEQYIDPNELLNESFEKDKGDFEFYRKKKGIEIVRLEKEEKERNRQKRSISSQKKNQNDEEVRYKIKMPQNQVISELDPVNVMVSQTKEKIRYLEYQCEKLKKRVMQPDFAMGHKTSKKSIQKMNVTKENIFNENDFQKLIREEEQEEMNQERHEIKKKPKSKGFITRVRSKGKADSKNSHSYKSFRTGFKFEKASSLEKKDELATSSSKNKKEETQQQNTEEDLIQEAQKGKGQQDNQKALLSKIKEERQKRQEQETQRKAIAATEQVQKFQKTCEQFGVYSKQIIDFRIHTLREAKLQRMFGRINYYIYSSLQDQQEFETCQNNQNEFSEQSLIISNDRLKAKDMSSYLLTVMTKPTLDKKITLVENFQFHQRRVNEMHKKVTHIATVSR